jgi:hypothetical protein
VTRRILFVLASAVLAGLLVWLWRMPPRVEFVRAALADLALVSWTSFVLPLRGLPRFDAYYRLRRWERNGRIFQWVGVPLFREFVRKSVLARFNRSLPSAWKSGDPERIEDETRTAEAAHGVAFLLALGLAIAALAAGHTRWAIWIAVLDLPLNFYPVLLQRDLRHQLIEKIRTGEMEHP